MDIRGIPLNPALIRGYILELLAEVPAMKAEEVQRQVEQRHEAAGGQPATVQDKRAQFKKALALLKQQGHIENPTEGWWRTIDGPAQPVEAAIEEQAAEEHAEVSVGEGPESVYGWYFPRDRENAELKGESRYAIKVGHTARSPGQRIEESWGMSSQKPRFGFHFKCNNARDWERFIQLRLMLNGRHIGHAIGAEWFMTNLEELKGIATEDITINYPADGSEQ